MDFNFVHLSNENNDDQRKAMAHIFYKLRKALDDGYMTEKTIGYSCMYSAMWDEDTIPEGYT